MRRPGLLITAVLLLLIAACGTATPGAALTPEPTLERLPTVTPMPSAPPPATTLIEPAHTPTAPITPTRIAPIFTDAGPVTANMAQLQLGGEPYAALGDPDAPITVVEFSDFGCPFCRIYSLTTFAEIKTRYIDTGKVYYIYKDLPIVSTQGHLAAQAAECAGKQNAYWEMHHKLFLTPDDWNASAEAALVNFRRYAEELELDASTLAQCVAEEQLKGDIDEDFAEAQALRLGGTPAFFINARLLSGAQPIEFWTRVLDDELANQ